MKSCSQAIQRGVSAQAIPVGRGSEPERSRREPRDLRVGERAAPALCRLCCVVVCSVRLRFLLNDDSVLSTHAHMLWPVSCLAFARTVADGPAAAAIAWQGGSTGTSYQDSPFAPQGGAIHGSYVSDAGTFVLAETALDMHCWGDNPVVTAKLQLNGQDRFSEREGSYFDVVQPYQHHTRNPDAGINCYSFALRPEEHQPSGSCNFSRIDNAVLQLVLSSGSVMGTATAKVRVYAKNYNVLRVMSGMAGVAYSN